jgi:hypothetical protein
MQRFGEIEPGGKLCDDARVALSDLFHWSNYYWGLTLEEKPHRWMCDELMQTLTMTETPHLMLDVPRGCYKTSIVISGAVLQWVRQWLLYDNPYHRIVYASSTLGLGHEFLQLVESVLRTGGLNGRIDEDFGPLWKVSDESQRKTSRRKFGIVLKPRMDRGEIASVKEPNFFIASVGSLPIGYHADGAILDDLNNKKNVSTAEQIKKTHEFYHQMYPIINAEDRLGNPSHVWMSCTPWHDNDVRGMILREEEERKIENASYVPPWRHVKATAHMEDGSLFFPTKLSEPVLEQLKRHMGSEYWAAYEGSPVSKQDAIASEEQIRYKPRDEFPALRWCRIVVDPNEHNDAKSLGCYAAIVMGGYDQFAKLWISDIWASREWDSEKFIEKLYEAQEQHPSWPMFIEDEHMTHFDHALNLEYVRRMSEEERLSKENPGYQPRPVTRLKVNWTPAPRHLSKYERCEGLKPRFYSAAIIFAQEISPSVKAELTNELVRGRASRYKDVLDALAMMENGIVPRYKPDGSGEKIAAVASSGGTQKSAPTFGDAFGGVFDLVEN